MTEVLFRGYRSAHLDHKALVDEIQRIDPVTVRPGNVVVVVPDRKSRCSYLKCFIDRLKVLGNGAGSAGLGDGIFYMTEREIEASTEVADIAWPFKGTPGSHCRYIAHG